MYIQIFWKSRTKTKKGSVDDPCETFLAKLGQSVALDLARCIYKLEIYLQPQLVWKRQISEGKQACIELIVEHQIRAVLQNLLIFAVFFGMILPSYIGIVINHCKGIPINQPFSWKRFCFSTDPPVFFFIFPGLQMFTLAELKDGLGDHLVVTTLFEERDWRS